MSVRFVHLKVHSEYSLMDSIIRIKPMLSECVQRKLPAIALTDMCNLFAAVKFYKAALDQGIKPIFGSEIYIQVDERIHPLTLIAKDNAGYQTIVELISYAYLNATRKDGIPILPKNELASFNFSQVFVLSGGQKGELGYALMTQDYKEVLALLDTYMQIFPRNNFFIELQRLGVDGEERYIQSVIELAKDQHIAVVATNDVRFLDEENYSDHEIRVGIYQGYTLLDQNRKSQYTTKQYLRSSDEMCELFADIPQSLSNTVYIAENANVTFKLGGAVLPRFEIPQNMTEAEYFAKVSYEGLEERFDFILHDKSEQQKQMLKKKYKARLQLEVDVICQMGFPGYFLIVADFIQWSKDNGIPVGPGRGSGAGSLVAYALKITDIDPIPYGLLFERFLNPERVSMPDFDIDFCMDGRDSVIEYVAQKYGSESVSQIITYGSMAAKAVVRDVGRVLAQPYGFVDKIAKLIPNDLGIKLKDACAPDTPLYELCQQDETADEIIKIALKLEGLTRSVGKHAAGVVISPSKVTDFSPIYCEEGSKQLVTQFDKKDVEDVGLVKFDFLGLRNLTIIDNALKIANKQRRLQGEADLNIVLIPMNDKKTFQLLQNGETTGVFQLESRGMKELIKRLKPDCFEDIIALVALYRPGPLGSGMVDDFVNRKHGRQRVSYPHPALEEVLKETYGTILYQEQVMQIAQILANYSLGGADLLRRAMGKKNPEEMAKQRETFEKGAFENGIDRKLASSIFDLMEEFAKYGFNKSHSAAYALVSYQTAYLKAHYPQAFMAAVLSSDMDNTEKVVNFINECQKMKLSLVLPHINISDYYFTVDNKEQLVYGLGAVKGVGFAAIDGILTERVKNGVYKNLYDLCLRVDLRKVNKRVCEALIYAGAMDGFANNRQTLIATLEDAMKSADQKTQMQSSGQLDLFGFDEVGIEDLQSNKDLSKVEIPNWTIKDKLIYEKSVLGMFLSGHLIDEDRFWLNYFKVTPLNRITPTTRKESILLAGVVVSIAQRKTKSGKLMGALQIDDGYERLELVIFSDLYDSVKHMISVDQTVIVEGEVSIDGYNDQLRINALDIQPIEQYVDLTINTLNFNLPIDKLKVLYDILLLASNGKGESNLATKKVKLTITGSDYQLMTMVDKLAISAYALTGKINMLSQHQIELTLFA
ncbi:DNA polymerase III subunit alpha [Fastidiosibacter lacustris]|uniref:DNA polymerase III subunit alpha n=1 Tax=Fastidiosibacter lacustris TaxID=2056695 RepID=UPI000E341F92|nr:DNA polymerase III subunit alpha [Fastidiosibacter lacustris]